MKESLIRDFLLGTAAAEHLSQEAVSAVEHTGNDSRRIHIEDLEEDFEITSSMALKLCDALIDGRLDPEALAVIGFTVIASDHLEWPEDDDVLGEILYDWSSPEINYQLTPSNLQRCRRWLLREEAYPSKPETRNHGTPRLLSVTEKRRKLP